MELILVRHGARLDHPDGDLSPHGQHQVVTLARALRNRERIADCVLTSRSPHARETADRLRTALGAKTIPQYELDSLTPRNGPSDIDTVVGEAMIADPELRNRQSVVLVGHEGRLSDLVAELTRARTRPLGHGEAIGVRAAGLAELVSGRGQVEFRYPTYDHQDGPLQSKVELKMTVSTFLAGFVFTALSGLLLLTPDHNWSVEQVVAVIALAVSLLLYVACVYFYDQLGMPSGFWTDARRTRWRRLAERFERRRERRWHALGVESGPEIADDDLRPWLLDGPRYHLMVSTSRWLFTPATPAALVGFVAMVKGTQDIRILIGAGVGLLLAGGVAVARHPALAAD